jgi:hypothetical protein
MYIYTKLFQATSLLLPLLCSRFLRPPPLLFRIGTNALLSFFSLQTKARRRRCRRAGKRPSGRSTPALRHHGCGMFYRLFRPQSSRGTRWASFEDARWVGHFLDTLFGAAAACLGLLTYVLLATSRLTLTSTPTSSSGISKTGISLIDNAQSSGSTAVQGVARWMEH